MAVLEFPKPKQSQLDKDVHLLKETIPQDMYDKMVFECFLLNLSIYEIQTSSTSLLLVEYNDFIDALNEGSPEMAAMPVKRDFFEYRVNDLRELVKNV